MIKHIEDDELKSKIAQIILRDLPEWFGIEEALLNYVEHVKACVFFAYESHDEFVGFIALEENPISYDMHVLGILKAYHRLGIGEKLLAHCEAYGRSKAKKYMTVKTLSSDHPDLNYKKTRLFYEAMGYEHLEVFKTLWGEENPCLYMIKSL